MRRLGNSPRYGWRVVDGKPERVEHEFAMIERIRSLAEHGVGPCQVAKILNDEGQTTRRGKKWSHSLILYIAKEEGFRFEPVDNDFRDETPEYIAEIERRKAELLPLFRAAKIQRIKEQEAAYEVPALRRTFPQRKGVHVGY